MNSTFKLPQHFLYSHGNAAITEDQWREFEQHLQKLSLTKGDFLTKPGERADSIYLIESGILRNYYMDTNGREYTKRFLRSPEVISTYAEVLQHIPSRSFIQSVTNSIVWKFEYQLFEKMMEKYPEWQVLGRKIAESNFIEKEQREFMLLQSSALERYQEFLDKFSSDAPQIPQYQVASYLGITPEAFNRILKNLKNS